MIPLEELVAILACPACRTGELELAAESLLCSSCGHRFEVRDGLPILVGPASDALSHAEAEAHAELAPRYELVHQLETLRNRRAHAAFLEPLAALPAGSRVLDVACGTGHDARTLLARGLEVVGIDITHEMLLKAREGLGETARLGLAVADGELLPFKDSSFDGVCIAAALHHFHKPGQVLSELARVARPDAAVVIGMEPTTWIYRTVIPLGRIVRGLMERVLVRDEVRSPADEETAGLSADAVAQQLRELGVDTRRIIPVWYVTGFAHVALETFSRLLALKRPLALPAWGERLLLALDAGFERVPLLRRLHWNWSSIAYKRSAP